MFAGNQLHEINLDRGDHYRNPYPPGFEPIALPEGESGDWKVVCFTLKEDDVGMFNLRLIRDGMWRRIVPPGIYTKLVHKGEGVVMSDTPAEAHEHRSLYVNAKGSVLVNGLGLGFGISAILRKPEVEHVTVIEKSLDVICLVAPTLEENHHNITIINSNAMSWRPEKGERFDVVWHDIWTTICDDNKEQMTKLRRAYGHRCGWQGCWSQEYVR